MTRSNYHEELLARLADPMAWMVCGPDAAKSVDDFVPGNRVRPGESHEVITEDAEVISVETAKPTDKGMQLLE